MLCEEIDPKQIKEAYQQVVQKINPSLKTLAVKKLAEQSESLSNHKPFKLNKLTIESANTKNLSI